MMRTKILGTLIFLLFAASAFAQQAPHSHISQLSGLYPNPTNNVFSNEFHSTDYGTPTPPTSAIPKLTSAGAALTGTIASGSNSLTLSGSLPAGVGVGNWIAIGGKTATDNPGQVCGFNWMQTSASAKYASGCHTTATNNETDNGPMIPSGGSKGHSGLLATPEGTTGAATVSYQLCIYDGAGGIGECTTPASATTANATVSWTNDVKLTWLWNQLDEPEAEVCKSFAGTYEPIGIAVHSSFRDVGQAAITNDPDLPNCPGGTVTITQRRPEYLYAQITAISGTTLTLSASAQDAACSGGSCPVFSDDSWPINEAIWAAEAANVAVAGGGNETNSNQGVLIDSGQYTVAGQLIEGEQTGTLVIRGYGATLWDDGISGPTMIITGSGCDINTTSGYPENCNRGGRQWLEGVKFVGNGSNNASYPDEYALYIGGNNGTYITDNTFNNYMGVWQGCISGNASGLVNDEHLPAGSGTSWTHVYFTNDRMNACGGPWVQIGDITAVDDPEFVNFFFKNSGQATGSNVVGPQSGSLFLGAFNPALINNRYQLPSNTDYIIHIANAQQGGMYSDYMQTPQSIGTAMVALDGTVGFGVDRVNFNMTTQTPAIDGIDLINSAAGTVITSPVFYNSGGNTLNNGVNFSADASATTGNYLISYQTTGSGSAPTVEYTNLGSTNFVLPDSLNDAVSVPINFSFPGTVVSATDTFAPCPMNLRYGPGFQATIGSTKPSTPTSYGVAGTAPSPLDTYVFSDAGTAIGDIYLGTGGTAQFGSPGCSPAPDGHGAAQGTTITSLNVTATAGATTDSAILICAGANTTNTWTTPAGCSAIAGATDTTTINSIAYECDNTGGTALSYNCVMSPTAANMSAGLWAFKNVPTGSMVDRSSVRHNASGTSCQVSQIATGRVAGSTALATCDTPTQSITFSAPTNPWSLISGSSSQGAIVWYLGPAAQVTGNPTLTMGTSVTTGFMFYLKPALNSSCTLCTAGDRLDILAPTVQGEHNVSLSVIGVP